MRNKAKIILSDALKQSQYPYQGIGIKLGDPFALSYKFYANKNWSFAANAGKAASGLYNKYYRNAFNTYVPDSLEGTETMQYLTHKANQDWLLEAKFLYQWDASENIQRFAALCWSWMVMAQYKSNLTITCMKTEILRASLVSFRENRFTYGPVALAGFEYSYFSLPLSAFIEVEWFTDVLLDPGYQRFQGGVGIRYVFLEPVNP
ncbi:MAG: hypothetical protein U5K54_29145 [Cytophagales bacterium]|nr:hypothetical protein [Cytophagales bacterium]